VPKFLACQRTHALAPLLHALQARAEQVRSAELKRAAGLLADLDDREREAVETLTRSMIAKLLHDPMKALKEQAGTAGGEALASGKIDLAVHSAKDLPAKGTDGVVLAAIPKREDPRDALVTRTGAGLNSLQPGTTVGTSSMRRRTQLLALQRGLVPTPIRG